jgi:hypothetical protein
LRLHLENEGDLQLPAHPCEQTSRTSCGIMLIAVYIA